jgi:copper(I)-binding protein
MTRGPLRACRPRLFLLVLGLLGLAGCTIYPQVADTGGVRIQPRNGRLVLDAANAYFFVDLDSTSLYGDVLYGAEAPVARRSQLVGPAGEPVGRLEIPGHAVVRLQPGGHRVVFSEFTRPLVPGETLIVTLYMEKYRQLGVVTVVE